MTEINWTFTILRGGAVAAIGALSTFDLSFPQRALENFARQYGKCTIQVRNSRGEFYEKDWE